MTKETKRSDTVLPNGNGCRYKYCLHCCDYPCLILESGYDYKRKIQDKSAASTGGNSNPNEE